MHSQQQNQILNGVIWKQILIFFFPVMLGTLFQQLYNTADVAIVGRYAGKLALAAVGGPSSLLVNLLVNLFVGICSGATVIVAQVYGAAEERRMSRAVHTAMWMGIVFGGALSLFGFLASEWILRMIGTPQEMLELSVTYLRIYFSGTIFTFIYNMGSSVLRAIGDSTRPFWLLVISTLINIAADMLFIVTFGWGVAGAAYATIMSQGVSAVGVLFFLVREQEIPPLRVTELLRPSFREVYNIIRIGLPAGLQSAMYSLSNIVIQSSINVLGVDTVAAWATYSKVDRVYWSVLGAFTIALSTFSGQNFGAQKYDRVYKSIHAAAWLSCGYTVLFATIYLTFDRAINGLFTSDPEVLDIASQIVWILTPLYILYLPIEALAGGMRGTGDSLVPMIATLMGVCGFRLLWVTFIVPFHHDIHTIMIGYPISWALTSAFFLLYHWKGNWMKRSIARACHDAKNTK